MSVRHIDVRVELHVHGGLGDKGHEREAQLRQDHHQVRHVPSTTPHYPSRPMNPTSHFSLLDRTASYAILLPGPEHM